MLSLMCSVLLGQSAYAVRYRTHPTFQPLTYTNFAHTSQQITEGLPCKWVSTQNRWSDRQKYDLLCTGGDWGTVTVMVDKASKHADQVGRIRLLWRNWDPKVHPAWGESQTAAIFLNFILNNFVPKRFVHEIQHAFWQQSREVWRGRYASMYYNYEQKNGYGLHKLEITGRGTVPEQLPQGLNDSYRQMPKPVAPKGKEIREKAMQVERKYAAPKPQKQQVSVPAPQAVELPVEPIQPQKVEPTPTPPSKPERVRVEPRKPVTRQVKDYQATIRILEDRIEINGLSQGQPLFYNTRLIERSRVDEVLKTRESELKVVAPPIGTDDYRKAADLTEEYTKAVEQSGEELMKEVEGFMLSPDQLSPLLEQDEEKSAPQPKKEIDTQKKNKKNSSKKLPEQPYSPAIPPAKPLVEEKQEKEQYKDTEQAL